MKIKKLLSVLAAVSILSTCGTTIAMAEGNADTAAAAASESAVSPITADMVRGTWTGSFMGYDGKGGMVENPTVINIDECDDEGNFSGLLTFVDTEDESYFFEGKCNFETGEFTLEGIEWKINANKYGMFPFSGKIDPEKKTMTGFRNNDTKSSFSYEKTSDKYDSYSIDPAQIKREWYGEYDGINDATYEDGQLVDYTAVRRNIMISITDIADDGTIKGYAKFTPSDKADQKYDLVGSYYFTGTIDKRFGRIKFQGDEWIGYPAKSADDTANYQMIPFSGAIFGNTIEGMTDYGIWKMESTDVLKGDLNFDNKLGVEDLVILEKYLLNNDMTFNKTMFNTADMNDDEAVNTFDLVALRKAVVNYNLNKKP
ncbi:dockerin type I repeat-containing protein [Ruminococcus sp. XPD3002]|uniref:dockerin type I repeat-containing protein n=1 Tax=Ruminococcus sp. XPD3002 TaxID=1452269 RepID=UPI000921839C|nr:hypothetical protein SAMN04487832_103214 [Ruminococcus flavefaciens]